MPRRRRVFVEGGIYHVHNRFARGAELFSEPEEAVEFIAILRKASHRDDLRVCAWALMFNHYHMAVRASQIPLSSRARYQIPHRRCRYRTMETVCESDGKTAAPVAGCGEPSGKRRRGYD
jgi:REP element-mobilizing transposase RayT